MVRDPADEPASRLSPDRLQAVRLRAEAVAAAMRQRQPGLAAPAPVPSTGPAPMEASDSTPDDLAPLDATRRSPEELAAEISQRMARWKQSQGPAQNQIQSPNSGGVPAARAYVLPMHPGRAADRQADRAAPAPAADPNRWTVSIPPDYFARELYLGTRAPMAAAKGRKRHYLAIALIATLGVLLPDFLPPARVQDPVVPPMATPAATGTPDQKLSAAMREPVQLAPTVGQEKAAIADPVEMPPVAATPEKTIPVKAEPAKQETPKKDPVKKEAVKVAKPAPLVPSPDAMKPKPFEPMAAPVSGLPKYTPPATQPVTPQPKPYQPTWP